MTESQPPKRLYNEQEIRAILQRTVEMQATHSGSDTTCGSHTGMSLLQLQQAASELGIDPTLVEQAAAEVANEHSSGLGAWLFGGPWDVDSDHIVEGVVTEDDWPALLEDMRAATGRIGYPKTIGKAFEWLSHHPDSLHISITPKESKTRVRVTARFGQWGVLYTLLPTFALVFAVILCIALGKSGITPSIVWSMLFGFPLVSFIGARLAFRRLCARKRRQTRDLIVGIDRWISRRRQHVIETSPAQILPSTRTVDQPLAAEQTNFLSES